MLWKIEVVPVSHGLEETGYAHRLVSEDGHKITVAHHRHKNYDYIHVEKLPCGGCRRTGYGPRAPDLTPHPYAVKIAAALNS